MSKRVILGLAACVSMVFLVSLSLAQPGGGQGGGQGGQGGGFARGGMGGGMGMMGMGQFNEASVKLAIGVTDQQWAPIKPKFDKVAQLLRDSQVTIRFMSGRRGRGGDAGAAPAEEAAPRWMRPSAMAQQELTEGQKAAEALLDLIEKKDSDTKQIQQKMEALRAIRQKAQKDLATAQADLSKALNERQQAVLSLMGVLN